MGPSSVLSSEEEDMLEKWIIDKAKLGFPINSEDVKDSVHKVLLDSKRDNPFKDSRPGKKWMNLFLQRHPNIVKCRAEMLSKARASVTETNIRVWFKEVRNYLKEQNCEDILEDPTRIFNSDETGVQCCPKSGLVLGPKKYKNLYDIAPGQEKESITVLTTFSADGRWQKPMIVYPYKRMPLHISLNIPKEFALGRSDSGWMVSATFFEYMANVFHPWLIENKVKLPVIFFMDGHKSHLSLEVSEFCATNSILLYCFPPNATHILQPP